MFSHTIPNIIQRLAKSYTWKVKTNDKKLYFTFDDGPHPDITHWVLEQLALMRAKATFFCVGENVYRPQPAYNAILKAGHAIGNHTYNHVDGWKTENFRYYEK